MLHSETLKLLTPVELGPTHQADQALEGGALDAAQSSADRLLTELLPTYAHDLLPDWERVLGITPLPGDTVALRQARCLSKLRARGGMGKQHFIDLAADLGVTVEIYELAPFQAGISYPGLAVVPAAGVFVWRVRVLASPGQYFRAGQSASGESLGASFIAAVEAMFQELKPAHTHCLFQQ